MRFGIEYTFVVPRVGEWPNVRRNKVDRLRKKGFPRAYCDPHVVEVPSPPHRSLDEAKRFFDRLGRAVGLEKLTPKLVTIDKKGNECYEPSGGGHVHVELPKRQRDKVGVLSHLVAMACNRPWLGWVFNEWGDDINSKALLNHTNLVAALKDEHNYLPKNLDLGDIFLRIAPYNTSLSPGNNNQTVEFRIFDVPQSWQQTKDHVEFALALVSLAKERYNKKEEPEKIDLSCIFKELAEDNWPCRHRYSANFTEKYKRQKDIEIPFKKLVKTLGLDWTRYRKYIKNVSYRFRFGNLT